MSDAARERARAHLAKPVAWYGESKLMAEDVLTLATEIERLREALRQLAEGWPRECYECGGPRIAREAVAAWSIGSTPAGGGE